MGQNCHGRGFLTGNEVFQRELFDVILAFAFVWRGRLSVMLSRDGIVGLNFSDAAALSSSSLADLLLIGEGD